MKKTAQQILKQVKQEPVEIAKTAFEQVKGQGVRGEEGKEEPGYKESAKKIEKLKQQERSFQDKAIPEIREKLGISAGPGKTAKPTKPQATGKAPAMPSPYEASLTAQIAKLRKEVLEKEAADKARKAKEAEEQKRREEVAGQELRVPPSRRPEKVAPWARKIKAGQGTGELRPSFGKQ